MTLGALISRIVGIYLFVKGLTLAGESLSFSRGAALSQLLPVFAIPIILMIGGTVLFVRPARFFDVELPSSGLGAKRLELVAFRVVGLLVVFEAAIPILFGSLTGLLHALLNPEAYSSTLMEPAQGLQMRRLLGRAVAVVFGVIQLLLGMWLLLHPENLISRIERWRAKRQLGYFEEDPSETITKTEEN
ncbi:MAG: hypothetical protein KY429_10730 [Actinobacteria bacterium]|nr:hypothetical protein [Actinomycetota bacterium]